MTSSLYILKPVNSYNEYGERQVCNTYEVSVYRKCVNHYPSTNKTDIVEFGKAGSQIEATKELEIAWITLCNPCCELDVDEGYFAYLMNKFWKIVGLRVTDDCGCKYIKLTLQRLEPRESKKSLIECVNCYADIKDEETCK